MIGHGSTTVDSKAGTFRDMGTAHGCSAPGVHSARTAAPKQFSKSVPALPCQRSKHGLHSTSERPMPGSNEILRTVPTRGGVFPERWRTR